MIHWRETVLARSTAARTAVAMAGAFAVSMAVAFIVAQALVARDLEARIRTQVGQDATALSRLYEDAGAAALLEQIRIRNGAQEDAALYLWIRPGESRTEDVPGEAFTGWRRISIDHGESGDNGPAEDYLALGRPLGEGTLVVARSVDAVGEVREIFTGAMLWGLGIALGLTLAVSVFVTIGTERRIKEIADALAAVSAGKLGRRVPVRRTAADDLARVGRAINAMLDRLEQNIASLSQVSSDIAHDLRTPVQHLRATLEALQRQEGDLTPRTAAIVEEAIGQADRIVRTFQALLRIAQIERGSPRTRFRPTDLAELTQAVAEAFQPAVEEAGHRFSVQDGQDGTLVTLGDRDLLAQVLANLLTNAIRHSGPGSGISLSVQAEGGEAVLIVADSGTGIPAEERERVFRRLYRLERSRTTEGSGLGLAMVRAIVDLHGGSIRLVDNNPGLRAVVRLPLLRSGDADGRRDRPSARQS